MFKNYEDLNKSIVDYVSENKELMASTGKKIPDYIKEDPETLSFFIKSLYEGFNKMFNKDSQENEETEPSNPTDDDGSVYKEFYDKFRYLSYCKNITLEDAMRYLDDRPDEKEKFLNYVPGFEEMGLIEPMDDKSALESWYVDTLKCRLKEEGLKVSGRKAELIERLLTNGYEIPSSLRPYRLTDAGYVNFIRCLVLEWFFNDHSIELSLQDFGDRLFIIKEGSLLNLDPYKEGIVYVVNQILKKSKPSTESLLLGKGAYIDLALHYNTVIAQNSYIGFEGEEIEIENAYYALKETLIILTGQKRVELGNLPIELYLPIDFECLRPLKDKLTVNDVECAYDYLRLNMAYMTPSQAYSYILLGFDDFDYANEGLEKLSLEIKKLYYKKK